MLTVEVTLHASLRVIVVRKLEGNLQNWICTDHSLMLPSLVSLVALAVIQSHWFPTTQSAFEQMIYEND